MGAGNPERPKYTFAQIKADPAMMARMVEIGTKRYSVSSDYMRNYHDKWLRFFKLYRNIVDVVDDSDEPNTSVVYAYALVEDLVSKISEPLLQMKPPCRVTARRAQHEKAAERFSAMCSAYFRVSDYQLGYTQSVREEIITGNAWEKDCWFNEYDKGRRWAKVAASKLTEIKSFLGKIIGMQETPYTDVQEVPANIPRRIGYGTEFPSLFRVWPEPNVAKVENMLWLNEEVPSAALSDLEGRMTLDPATKKQIPFFDFSEIRRDYKDRGTIMPEPMSRQSSNAEDELRLKTGDQPAKDKPINFADDIDRVSLMWCWERDRVFVIANGRYLVAYMESPFQKPRIPFRLRCYTPQKDFLFGLGALEPVENQLNELNDIHKMSMRNWVRIINRMVAYNEEAIPFEDDFTPSALGRVRVRPPQGQTVGEQIVPIHHDDVTPSMLAQESNIKGIIERALSVPDYSAGTEGTKQTHKTFGGLMEISKNVAERITTVRRMHLACYQAQMSAMEALSSQFMMDKQPFTVYGPDGSTALEEFDLWDIYTEGAGFDYLIEYDPSFGDDQVRRNQLLAVQQQAMSYIAFCRQMGMNDAAVPDIEEIERRIFQIFGWSDTSLIMKRPNGVMSPDEELKMMMSGQPVPPNPKENVVDHIANHEAQVQMLTPLVLSGKVPEKALFLLKAHLAGTRQMAVQLVANPAPMVAEVLRSKMGSGGGIPTMAGQSGGAAGGEAGAGGVRVGLPDAGGGAV